MLLEKTEEQHGNSQDASSNRL